MTPWNRDATAQDFLLAAQDGLCVECLGVIEPCNAVECAPGGRVDTDLCRACWEITLLIVGELRA